jgi:hypothetical protein
MVCILIKTLLFYCFPKGLRPAGIIPHSHKNDGVTFAQLFSTIDVPLEGGGGGSAQQISGLSTSE